MAISMDGKGGWRDNVFVERVWRSIKYEEVYLHAYTSVSEARTSIGRYLAFYNSTQPETAHARSGKLQPPARTHGSIKNKNKNFHLRKKQKLSELPGPPHAVSELA
jgi:hypothetical protein